MVLFIYVSYETHFDQNSGLGNTRSYLFFGYCLVNITVS